MKEVKVEYFALLMQEAKKKTEKVTTSVSTLGELYQQLRKTHGFSLTEKQVRAAVNQQLVVDWNTPLAAGDHILFIPPLVGG
jgi:molybdopterin converting factor small subunit